MTAQPAPARGRRGRSRLGWAGLAALLVFMGFVVYRSLHLGGFRCEVCIEFHGRSQCRTVDGETRDDALRGATDNTCAYLASGVTDGIACQRTPPTRAECNATD